MTGLGRGGVVSGDPYMDLEHKAARDDDEGVNLWTTCCGEGLPLDAVRQTLREPRRRKRAQTAARDAAVATRPMAAVSGGPARAVHTRVERCLRRTLTDCLPGCQKQVVPRVPTITYHARRMLTPKADGGLHLTSGGSGNDQDRGCGGQAGGRSASSIKTNRRGVPGRRLPRRRSPRNGRCILGANSGGGVSDIRRRSSISPLRSPTTGPARWRSNPTARSSS